MTIKKNIEGEVATVVVEGRLDTMTAPELQGALSEYPGDVRRLVFDFSALEYISSAGLRVLLSMHKQMSSVGGEIQVVHANTAVKDVFEMTGFSDIFTVV
ncbi:MAG: STAS domain-containing protein [Kiritimatiellae bacterium]|nr:STAS domain-containing protein [Kiritimatiellia bacterium]